MKGSNRKEVRKIPAEKPHFTFVVGRVDEASSVNFPADAAIEIVNVNLDVNGFIKRRLGLELV